MNEKLITVVVPIYNVEKYLDQCIESIVNQTYRNLEIILVDDGSPDACPRICDEWAKRDSRIRVIHKENQGAGMARNTGIDHAKGEYICFFDSDDYVDLRAIQKAIEKAEKYDADIVIYGLKDFDEAGEIISDYVPVTEKNLLRGDEIREHFLPDLIDSTFKGTRNRSLPFSVWSCIFSMRLIEENNWRFVSEREVFSEDSYSLLKLYENVFSVYVLNESLYYHRTNLASLSRSFNVDRFARTKDFTYRALMLADECCYNDEVQSRICGLFFNFTIETVKQIVLSNARIDTKIKLIRQISSDSFFRTCLKKCKYGKRQIAKRILKNVIYLRLNLVTYVLVYLKTLGH